MSVKNVPQNISAIRWNRTDETVMFALVEWTLCFEDLPFCLFNISELKDLIFHDTQLIIVYKNHNISYYIAIFDRVQDLIY